MRNEIKDLGSKELTWSKNTQKFKAQSSLKEPGTLKKKWDCASTCSVQKVRLGDRLCVHATVRTDQLNPRGYVQGNYVSSAFLYQALLKDFLILAF